MSFLIKMNDMVELADNLLNDTRSIYENTKKEYQAWRWVSAVGSLILVALCIGVMYIRFRVFGG